MKAFVKQNVEDFMESMESSMEAATVSTEAFMNFHQKYKKCSRPGRADIAVFDSPNTIYSQQEEV